MLKIIFAPCEKRFIAAEGSKFFRSDYVFGNGWNCRVNYDGSVKCTVTDTKNGKYIETCFKISKDGLVSMSRFKEGTRYPILRYRIKGWPVTGVISLTGGPIEERKVFFKDINSYK